MNLKDFSNKLNQIGKNAQKTNYSAEELLTNDFFRKNTKFSSLQEFLDCGNFPYNLKEIDENAMNTFVSNNTKFNTWVEMLEEATVFKVFKPLL